MNIVFVGVGLFAILCTYYKPSFYWDSRKAMRMRRVLGDMGASILYYVLGSAFLVYGVLGALGIVALK